MNIIVTWMYCSPPGENIVHPQTGKYSSSRRIQNYYWRCVFLLFESSARLNGKSRHLLFINESPPNEIDGIRTADLIVDFNIELVQFPSITKSPVDYHGSWNTQFIVLDVLDWLSEHVVDNDAILILDSDIVFNKSLDQTFFESLKKNKALLYSIDYPASHSINGLTQANLLEIAKDLDSDFRGAEFIYSGGEFVCCLGSQIKKIGKLARETYEMCLQRHKCGKKKFNEEAHLLSYVYAVLEYKTHTANRFIKRIWTDRSIYSNIDGAEEDLLLWHLPAEKKAGFVRMFRSLRRINGVHTIASKKAMRTYRLEESIGSKIKRVAKTIVRRILSHHRNSWASLGSGNLPSS